MKFSERNRRRCEAADGFNHALQSWSLSDWMTATLGELGEAANVAKKLNRVRDGIPGNSETDVELRAKLADELADTFIYLDLLAQSQGFDLEQIVEAKFQKTSAKIGYSEPRETLGNKDRFDEVMKDLFITHMRIMSGMLKLAVEKTPADAISMMCDYFEECGSRHESEENAALLDAWWVKAKSTQA